MKHAEVLKRLLPPGSYDPNAENLTVELEAEGKALDAAQANTAKLLREMFPSSCEATLPEWEQEYGLPDPCIIEPQTISERRAMLQFKVRARGGLSLPYFLEMAETLGYEGVTMGNYYPMSCDDSCDAAVRDEGWRGAWYVNRPDPTLHVMMSCEDNSDEVVDAYKTGPLECQINRLKPADTTVVFTYEET